MEIRLLQFLEGNVGFGGAGNQSFEGRGGRLKRGEESTLKCSFRW